ncbi:MAG: type II toxin-antitoxin system PemK/MazF family toxin, partial [Actinobacteria bacterium]|nr:type II toxin-antitoxin system PemK/MazF family toxin [Actinomycetota bacterium]
WYASLDPNKGREQAGERPVLIISDDRFNRGPAGLVVTVPLTTSDRGIVSHIPVGPHEGGLKKRSFIMCEQIRCISKSRLGPPLGKVKSETTKQVEDMVRIILGL